MDTHASDFEPLRSPEPSQAQPRNQGAALLSLGGLFFAQLAALTAMGTLLLATARDLPLSPETTASVDKVGASVACFIGSFFIGKALSEPLSELLKGVASQKTSLNAFFVSNVIMLLLSGYAKDQRLFSIGLLMLGSSCGLLRSGLTGLNCVEVEQRKKVLSYLYMFTGLGAFAGPFIGSQLYSLFETSKLFKTTICMSGLISAALIYYNIVCKDQATDSQRELKLTASGSQNAHCSQSQLKAYISLALLLVLAILILIAIPFSFVESTPRPNTDVKVSRIEEPSVDHQNIDLSVSHLSTTEDENKWGQYPKIIENLSLKYQIFGGIRLDGKTEYADQHVVVQKSSWRQTHLGMQGQYTDKDFGQLTSSLIGWGAIQKPGDQEKIDKMLQYSFDRPPAAEKWQLIGDGVSPYDVFQGELGDCYFLSALSAAAVHPERILRLMMQRGNSPKSAYCAAFCITGAWVEVIVDDRFPIRQDRVFPFCSAGAKKFWPMLLEKAYAKLYGGYWHIGSGGQALESLRDITGAPTEQIILKDPKDEATAFKRLKEAYAKNYIVTVGSKGEGEVKSSNGVIMGHAYALLAVVTLSNGQELLKLRNPWGRGEWNGDWGNKSSKWTAQLKSEVGWTDKEDGISFMTYADFKENFNSVSIARCHDSYYYSYLKTTAPDLNPELMQFTVAEAGEYYVGLSQKSKFFYPQLAKFEYVFMSAVIVKREDDGSFTYVGEFGKQLRDPWVQLQLQPGTYWALVYANWIFSNEIDYTFWTYGQKNTVIMKVVDQRSREGMTQVLVDVFSKASISSEEKWKEFFIDPPTKIPRCRSKYVKSKPAYGYYIFENKSTKKEVLSVSVTKTGNGVWLIYPQAGMTGANLKINPGESKMVIYRIQKQGFEVSFATSYRLG